MLFIIIKMLLSISPFEPHAIRLLQIRTKTERNTQPIISIVGQWKTPPMEVLLSDILYRAACEGVNLVIEIGKGAGRKTVVMSVVKIRGC